MDASEAYDEFEAHTQQSSPHCAAHEYYHAMWLALLSGCRKFERRLLGRQSARLLAGDKEKGFLVGAYSREDVEKEDFVYETTFSKGKTVVVERVCRLLFKEHRLTVMKVTIRNRK